MRNQRSVGYYGKRIYHSKLKAKIINKNEKISIVISRGNFLCMGVVSATSNV